MWITLTSSPINIAVNILLLTVIFSLLCFTKEMKMFQIVKQKQIGIQERQFHSTAQCIPASHII